MARPTIKDVARLARVSTATVSNVLNATSVVSPPLRARVREAVAELGFAPSRLARGLRMQTTHLIGVVVADITNPFFAELVRRIGRAANALGYTMLLCEADHDPARELAALQLLAAHQVEGVILAPTGPAKMYFEPPLADYSKPIVMVDRVIPDAPFDSACIDNRRAAYEVARYMLSLGHVRIAAVAGWRHLANSVERVQGFTDALAEVGLEASATEVVYGDFRQDRARATVLELIARPQRPTALFVCNNEMVIGAMQAISELGLSCPADISLAGIDDFPWAGVFAPRLTTARQPIEALAEHSVRMLVNRMQGECGPVERVTLSAELIVRQSCAPVDAHLSPPRFKRLAKGRTG